MARQTDTATKPEATKPAPAYRPRANGKSRAREAKTLKPAGPERFAECRALGHEWHHRPEPARPTEETPPLGFKNAAGFVSVCGQCSTVRIKWLSRFGHLGPTTYRYPDGYQTKGDETLSREAWRKTWVVSVFGG